MPTNKLEEDRLNEWARNWRRQQEEMSRQSQYQTQTQTPYNTFAPNWQQTPYQPQAQSFAVPQQPHQAASAQTSVLSPEIANAAFQKGFASKQKTGFPLKNTVTQAMSNVGKAAFNAAFPVYGGAQSVYKTGENIGERIGNIEKEIREGIADYYAYDPYTDVPNVISPNQTYIQNVTNLAKEAKRVGVMNLGDDKKHQYVSCFGVSNGMPLTVTGLGYGKEGYDIYKKIKNKKLKNQYGGTFGVLADSWKDLTNNEIGRDLGRNEYNCSRILKEE